MSLTRKTISYAVPGLAALALSGLAITPAAAQTVITFDDIITSSSNGSLTIPNGYQGLNWSNLGVIDAADYAYNPSGYQNGTVSGKNVGYSGGGSGLISTIAPGSTFTFNSGYFTATWNDGLSWSADGYRNGVKVFSSPTTLLNVTTPTLITLDFVNIDQIQFTVGGGTLHPGYAGAGSYFVMDNLKVSDLPNASATPEPSPLAALGLTAFGALGLVLRARRKKLALS